MEKTPVVTKEFIKKYIHNGNYYRGGCIRAFAKKNHLTIKEATVIIDEMTKNSLTPHHHPCAGEKRTSDRTVPS